MVICADDFFTPMAAPKSILQFESRLARFGKGLHADDGADADIDLFEICKSDGERSTGQFLGAAGGGGHGLFHQGLHAVFGHQDLQGGIGCATRRSDILAQSGRWL